MARRRKKNIGVGKIVLVVTGVIAVGGIGYGVYRVVKKKPSRPGLEGGAGELYTYTIVERPGGKYAAMITFPGGGGTALQDVSSEDQAIGDAIDFILGRGGIPSRG